MMINGFEVHSELLEEVYAERCVLHECLGACCTGGAWLDVEQLRIIAPHVEAIKANLPAERRDPDAWFSAPSAAEDAPDGAVIGTNVVDDVRRPGETCCVFLRPDDRLCALQVASQQIGLEYPGLKPLFCALYPLQIRGNEIVVDHATAQNFGAACRRACATRQPLYQVFQAELELILGKEGYEELRARHVKRAD